MDRELGTAMRLVLVTVVLCGLVYPLGILAFAAVAVPQKRLGSPIPGPQAVPVGFPLVAQRFRRPDYFWPRPSAVDYDASAAGGSNLSPNSREVRERAQEILCRLALPDAVATPADLLATSGSGLDPHISLAGALVQVRRLAKCRGIDENELSRFVEQHAVKNAPSLLGGEPLLNVLLLNLALDQVYPVP